MTEWEPEVTINLRLDADIKRRIEDAAKGEGLSVNEWAVRCFMGSLSRH